MEHLWIVTNKNDLKNVSVYTDNGLLNTANSYLKISCKTTQEALNLLCNDFYIVKDVINEEKENVLAEK